MAKCKFCGQGVRTAPVFHTGCWEQRANKVAEAFCDEYCRWPNEVKDQRDLIELYCSECVVAELLRMIRDKQLREREKGGIAHGKD